MIGHCSKCGKIWTLEAKQGVCQWCGQVATCQTTKTPLRSFKSKSISKKRLAQSSYEGVDGEWREWLEVAKRYERKVPHQERGDMRHTIMLELAKARKRDGKPLPLLRAYRIASLMVALHWRRELKRPPSVSFNTELLTEDGEAVELIGTVADDKAIDLDAWQEAKTWLAGCPLRLVEIATKKRNGERLTATDSQYLWRYHKREQKPLPL